MSAEKKPETASAEPAAAGGYRTLTPAGTSAAKPAQPAAPPAPAAAAPAKPEPSKGPEAKPDSAKDEAHPDPTRFGDWEVKGRCIDF